MPGALAALRAGAGDSHPLRQRRPATVNPPLIRMLCPVMKRMPVIALNGMAFDLSSPHGRMIATVLAGIAEFERELIQERIRFGIAAAKTRGKKLGRQPEQRLESDRLAPKVLALVKQGRSYCLIGRETGLSRDTISAVVKRDRVRDEAVIT